ncbi:hypothetical protein IWQ60_008247 [Tieghemiomyces parasiticus]|uniref:Uncharacterized protein n=1 Tax=Tieghemiomyces parasiticus TaxID=78921 RepID=A0A9W8A2H5_9FUNG|nr:hypothetical protein IWQ60_008247 [Tieghemiomyces parasiticus]
MASRPAHVVSEAVAWTTGSAETPSPSTSLAPTATPMTLSGAAGIQARALSSSTWKAARPTVVTERPVAVRSDRITLDRANPNTTGAAEAKSPRASEFRLDT